MNTKQWEAKAAALAAEHHARITAGMATGTEGNDLCLPTLPQLRRALVEIDQLLRTGPTPIQQRYKQVSEADLRTLTDEAQGQLDNGSLTWLPRDPVEAAAAQARALDRHLFQHQEKRGKPDDAKTDYLCTETQVHVVPRPFAKPPQANKISTTTYQRRGLVRHRLIPQEIDGYTIDLEWHPDLSLSFRRDGAKVMASLFSGLSLVRDKSFKNFVAAKAPCENEDLSLTEQAAAAWAGNIVVAVWPELTMPSERRDKLAAALKLRSKSAAPGGGPRIVAAGSWHEVQDAEVRNRMHVISGVGRPRFFHDKTLPLESRSLGTEELMPSYRIPVLITDEALIAFAICRDFCEAQISDVYEKLDVDLIVVPSYGDIRTIRAHRQQAQRLYLGPGTRVLVAQQIIPDEVTDAGAGFVLRPDTEPDGLDPSAMRTLPPSATHLISFKKV
jgi:hypothetical protein